MMDGERLPATRLYGDAKNSTSLGGKVRYGRYGCHRAFGTLGPRRETHNRQAKRAANRQRRRADHAAVQQSLEEV